MTHATRLLNNITAMIKRGGLMPNFPAKKSSFSLLSFPLLDFLGHLIGCKRAQQKEKLYRLV